MLQRVNQGCIFGFPVGVGWYRLLVYYYLALISTI